MRGLSNVPHLRPAIAQTKKGREKKFFKRNENSILYECNANDDSRAHFHDNKKITKCH